MLMVKPGLPYLDMVREVKDKVSSDWAGRACSQQWALKEGFENRSLSQKQYDPEQEPSPPIPA